MSAPLRRIAALIGLAGSSTAAWAQCEEKVQVSKVAQEISAGDAAFADMEDTRFQEARSTTLREIPCVEGSFTSTQAAALHRLQALGAFLDREHADAVGSFRALLAIAPGYQLPESLAPEGHPLRLYFDIAAGMQEIEGDALPVPRTGWVQIDGRAAETVPIDRPYLFQYFDESGTVAKTALVRPGLTPPDYPARPEHDGGKLGVHVPLVITAGAAAVVSGSLYLVAAQQESEFWDTETDPADLETIRKRANTLGALSTGIGVVALGTGVSAVVVGSW